MVGLVSMALAAPSKVYKLGRWLAVGNTAGARGPHGPLPDEACTSGRPNCRCTREPDTSAVASTPPMHGGGFHSAPAVSGSRASAMAWAEAISMAGSQLCDEGFEDEALGCFRVAGDLLEKVETWGRPA